MNEGRIFLYVSPNVILPIMFIMLAITSLTVHFAILHNTTWFGAFWQGGAGRVAATAAAPAASEPMTAQVVEEQPTMQEAQPAPAQ